MDLDPPSSTPRKVKFAPKAPPRRTTKQKTTNIEATEAEVDNEEAQQSLARKVREHLGRKGPRVEKKSTVQVAFSHGVASGSLRTFGNRRERTEGGSNAVDSRESSLRESSLDNMQDLATYKSTDGMRGGDEKSGDLSDTLIVKKKREYIEPWDYENSYYPVTLPLREPHSGDPELLDEIEFGQAQEYDESTVCSARELGLLDQDDAPPIIFFKFPQTLPLGTLEESATDQKESDSSSLPSWASSAASKGKEIAGTTPKGKEIAGSSKNRNTWHSSKKCCRLEELPEGCIGKLLVYRSGSLKLKIGNILYDVSPGSDGTCPQIVMAIDTTNKQCCELGQLNKRAVVTPDIDSMLE